MLEKLKFVGWLLLLGGALCVIGATLVLLFFNFFWNLGW